MAGQPCPVGGGQVEPQRCQRPAVRGDVVDDDGQHVHVVAEGEQLRVQRDLPGQVEGVPDGGRHRFLQAGLVDLAHRQRGACLVGVEDLLAGDRAGVREDGPQRLVAGDDVGEGGPQAVDVQCSAQAQHHGQVVGG